MVAQQPGHAPSDEQIDAVDHRVPLEDGVEPIPRFEWRVNCMERPRRLMKGDRAAWLGDRHRLANELVRMGHVDQYESCGHQIEGVAGKPGASTVPDPD